MALTGTANRVTTAERAREPRSLGVVAWFDGYAFGAYGTQSQHAYPRRLDRDEEREWRRGQAEGRRERVCHSWHGFTPCPDDHPPTLAEGPRP